MVYVIKRIKGKRYVYKQWKINGKTISKYVGSLVKIVNFYLENKDSFEKWTGRDLNPRPSPCEGDALPLSYRHRILLDSNIYFFIY